MMRLNKRKPTGREKNQESIELLEKLRYKLHSEDASTARRAAYHLSWMQEDGLEILQEALFGRAPRVTKSAAGYGLRNMQGRMKKMALDLLQKGLESTNRNTKAACINALTILLKMQNLKKKPNNKRGHSVEIRQVRSQDSRRRPSYNRRAPLRGQNHRR